MNRTLVEPLAITFRLADRVAVGVVDRDVGEVVGERAAGIRRERRRRRGHAAGRVLDRRSVAVVDVIVGEGVESPPPPQPQMPSTAIVRPTAEPAPIVNSAPTNLYLIVSVPSMPASRWPSTEQKNV
jgi:hypothetical protein